MIVLADTQLNGDEASSKVVGVNLCPRAVAVCVHVVIVNLVLYAANVEFDLHPALLVGCIDDSTEHLNDTRNIVYRKCSEVRLISPKLSHFCAP